METQKKKVSHVYELDLKYESNSIIIIPFTNDKHRIIQFSLRSLSTNMEQLKYN